MSDTAIELDFGDGRYRFWLPMARIIEIERLCGDKSILLMHEEMSLALRQFPGDEAVSFAGGGAARIRDVFEVIRCGAIGGGLSPIDAKQLADNYVDGRPIAETLPVAWAILNAAIMGVSLKKKAEAPESESSKPSAKVKS